MNNETNPKDIIGATKVSITKLPPVAVIHCAFAMMNGANKYGPYNWREKKITAHTYIDAAMRHLLAWFDGEEVAPDSGAHHLAHAMACCAILLDAIHNNSMIDDRARSNRSAVPQLLTALSKQINPEQK